MKRRILSILLLAALVIGLLPQGILSVSAYSDTDIAYPVKGGNLYFDKATGTITDCDESVTKADIPAQIEGVAVTSIGDGAFYGCSSMMSVTIPDGVTSIGDSAFWDCSSLTSVTLPDSVTSIGLAAFQFCSGLTSITIPDSVTSIGMSAFEFCSSLTSIHIPDSVTSIGRWAFADTAIYYAEEQWTDDVLYLGNWLIEAASTVSGDYVVVSGTIGIANGAFANCESLTSVTIPDSVTSIGEDTFSGCNSLTSVTLPDSVTSIGIYAFFGCYNLTDITIPDSVTSIGEGAFSGCSSLTEISVAEDNTVYTSENGVLFDKAKTALLTYPAGKPKAEYVIPDSVTSIGTYAFSTCYNLTDITIPDSVTSIGTYAFSACYNLTDITIPDSVTSIGEYAFGWSGLKSVTIPDSVMSIGDWTFYDCSGLTSVTLPDSVTSIGIYAFFGCENLTDITIPDSVTSIGESAFWGCRSLTSVHIPDSVTSIGWEAFADTAIYNAEERWIDGVLYLDNWLLEAEATVSGDYAVALGTTGIADGAFYGAFYGCSNLTSVTIPNSVTSIGEAAFYDCDNLQAVYFMGNAPALGDNAFKMWDEEANTEINLPGLTLYYIEGKEGWTSPTWNGYPTATWVPTYSYTDVSEKEWYYDAVQYATQNGLMNGVGDGKFDPEGSMTRAMLVTVLWRYEGEPAEGENTFTDVPNGTWYTDAAAWAASNGIVGGIGNGKFDPDGSITREQMATILFRYAQKKGIDTSKRGELSGFADSGKVSSWAKDAVQWTVAEGIINGSDGKLLPQGNATRAQVSAILMRFLENIVKA